MSMEDFVKTLNEEQKKALLDALNNNTPSVQHVPAKINNQTKKAINESFIVETKPKLQNQQRREPVQSRGNTWVDTGESRDILTPDTERTPRRREPPKKHMVECHVCGKEFKADKRFMYGEFVRCDRCVGKRR